MVCWSLVAVAEQNNLRFAPIAFSHTGQTHGEFKILVAQRANSTQANIFRRGSKELKGWCRRRFL